MHIGVLSRGITIAWLLGRTLQKHQHSDVVDCVGLTALISKTSRGQFGQAKAQQIQEKVRQSVGVGFLADAAQVDIRCLLAQLELLEDQREEVGRVQEELMETIPQYITTIPGIGIPTGAAILSEIGDIERFKTPAKLIAYEGIDATVYQSGQLINCG